MSFIHTVLLQKVKTHQLNNKQQTPLFYYNQTKQENTKQFCFVTII